MQQHILVLPDGTEICSGRPGAAVMAVQLSREVNTELLLAPGAAVAAMLQVRLLGQDLTIRAGDSLQLLDQDRQPIGSFIAQEPVLSGGLTKVTAYDRLILLDRDLSGFLQTLAWPMSLGELAGAICSHCGLVLETVDIPNGEFSVQCPTGDGITGRQLMMWIAQAAGCFCRATPAGGVALGWYTPAPVTAAAVQCRVLGGVLTCGGTVTQGILPLSGQVEEGVLTLEIPRYILSGGLQLETEPTIPIDRVQLRQTETDVGLVYPDREGENTLVIQGNPLLAAADAQMLLPVAETLYQRFRGISYTPGTLKLPTTPGLDVGQLLQVTDQNGSTHTLYVMGLERTAGGDTVTCTGSYNRDSATVVNNRSYRTLQGRVLQLRTDVEGIRAENSDSRGKLSRLQLDVEGIRGSVSATEGLTRKLTTLEQTAAGLQLSVEQLQTEGASKLKTAMGYTFDDRGLRIARTGQPMENLLDNTGMQVTRSGEPILQANHAGVAAADVAVRNFLIMGDHARFENYTAGRTACFWLEG